MFMKKLFTLALIATGFALSANAEEMEEQNTSQKTTTIEVPAWVKNVKFSGYGMLQYQGTDHLDKLPSIMSLR